MPKQVELKNVKITGGYFHEKQKMNRQITIPATYRQFYNTGRIDAFKLKWRSEQPNQPHIFWDSDVAKWIEGAAYTLIHKRDVNLESLIDSIIEDLVSGQTSEGYFNSYYQTVELANRFTNRNNHELYCAGHLIEGAVAYKKATGKYAFLNAMCRYADYIYEVFTDPYRDKNYITPGHEEIELALVKLYHETKNKKYLDLSKFFIDKRGTIDGEKQTNDGWASSNYAQDHLPVVEQATAEGHAVRCLYMFSGAADIAREFNDEKLKKACETVFDNIINKRMYVTGGIGGNYSGEAFSYDYDLPNELAYTETCASIAMIFFCDRMYLLTGEKKYIDIIELQLYNAVLSGISLHGDRFFYCNPLEVHPERRDYFTKIRNSQFAPEYERPEYFGCSCCPPNVIRLISSLGQYMYHVDGDDQDDEEIDKIYVNLYNSSVFEYNGVKIIQETDYPRSGKINITVETQETEETDKKFELYLRIPNWNKNFKCGADRYDITNDRYIAVNPFESGCDQFSLEFEMPVVELYANPKVHYCAGRIAIKRGPIVYCAEGVDNGDYLKSVKISDNPEYKCEQSQIDDNNIIKITCDCEIITEKSDVLYSENIFKKEKKRLSLIPYASWANRGRNEMLVWFMK
ncbi:MAG: glycoside hydrolase family 127 protein [Oscillospiraceae bacterium]|nr:glycoside hydrolase family 127 protein [Oscillospiraceae bacterium]